MARTKTEAGCMFWFDERVEVYPLNPTMPIWTGTITDVINYGSRDGFEYEVTATETGNVFECREIQLCPLYERLSSFPERYAAYEELSRECYPRYYQKSQG